MATETVQATEAEDEPRSREMDTELRAIGRMLRMLEEQEPEARNRIVAYLSSRFPPSEF